MAKKFTPESLAAKKQERVERYYKSGSAPDGYKTSPQRRAAVVRSNVGRRQQRDAIWEDMYSPDKSLIGPNLKRFRELYNRPPSAERDRLLKAQNLEIKAAAKKSRSEKAAYDALSKK